MSLKKIVFFSVIILSLLVINNLVHSIFTLSQKKNLVVQAQDELNQQKKENLALKKDIAVAKDPQFVEEEARNKLFLAKPGEGVVVIPTEYLQPSPVATQAPVDTRPNWKKWLQLFF